MKTETTLPEPITVCLTTIDARLATLHLTLDLLARQDYPNFTVRLYLSDGPYLLDKGVPRLPDACLRTIDTFAPIIDVRYVENIGSYRKLVPFLAENIGCDAIVITADDDTLYPVNWISALYWLYFKHRCIICYRGHKMLHDSADWRPYRDWMRQKPTAERSTLNLPTGKDGVLYNALYFDSDVLDMEAAGRCAKTADDLWFKWHTAFAQIPAYVFNTDYRSGSFPEVTKESTLYDTFNLGGANNAAVAALESLFVTRYGKRLLTSLIEQVAHSSSRVESVTELTGIR